MNLGLNFGQFPGNRGGKRSLPWWNGIGPTFSTPGNFVEREYSNTYPLTGLTSGVGVTTTVANANRTALLDAINGASPGDCLTVAPGTYELGTGMVEFNMPDITIKGLGATKNEVVFYSKDQFAATWRINAGGVHLYNFTRRVPSTGRSSLGESGEGNIWVRNNQGFRAQDILAWGGRDASFFLANCQKFVLNRVHSFESMSDAIHIAYGSNNGQLYDCVSQDSGDDGIGLVGYNSVQADIPHHIDVTRHKVDRQSWGRGIGLVQAQDITFHDWLEINQSRQAGIIIAREPQYGTLATARITFDCDIMLRNCNGYQGLDSEAGTVTAAHGAIHINNPDTDNAIEDIVFKRKVIFSDTGLNFPGQTLQYVVRAHGAGPINVSFDEAEFYRYNPANRLSLDLAAGSSVTTVGWNSSTASSGTVEPTFPPL